MKKKILGFLICTLFFVSSISLSAGDQAILSNLQPTVVIENPDDGTEVSDPYIVVDGYATGDVYIIYWGWIWEWDGGSQTGGGEIAPPTGHYEFSIDIGPLAEGENTITVTFYDMENGSGTDSVTVYYVPGDDSDPPEVVITSPDDGSEFEEPEIYVEGYADDHGGSGVVKLMWTHSWEGDQISKEEYFDVPQDTITFAIPITLREGENVIEVNAEDGVGNSLIDPPDITVYYSVDDEGVLIDSAFQAEQTVYVHDPEYGDDFTMKGPCVWASALDMIAGKNTYLFGYPYNDRKWIEMTCCNNKDVDIKFHWVFQIKNSDETTWTQIWWSPEVTVPKKSTVTFGYRTPIPDTPFQWKRWSEDNPKKSGEVRLVIYPDHTGGTAPCNCPEILQVYGLRKTHDIKVLFLPFTFGDGPAVPAEIASTSWTAFDTWRNNDLEPWWNAIYPVRENGIDTFWKSPIRMNLTLVINETTSKRIDNLTTYNALNDTERARFHFHLFKLGIAPSLKGDYDRVVILVHPALLTNSTGAQANGMAVRSTPTNAFKHAVIVNWSTRTKTCVHEVSHTYDLNESYLPGQRFKAVGYWVNKREDVLNSNNNRDLMWATYPIWTASQKSWIKKPNFKNLTIRLSEEKDPGILGISGLIDKKDNVELFHWYQLDEGFVDIYWGSTGDYLINAYDSNGGLVSQAGFNISFDLYTENIGILKLENMIFFYRVEWINEISRVDIVKASTNEVLASRTKTAHSPTVAITSPSPGEKIEQGEYEIKWTANDLDGDELIYDVFYRNTSEEEWYPLYIAHNETSFTYDFTNISKDDYQLLVLTTDGWNTDEDVIDFTIKKGRSRSNVMYLPWLIQLFEKCPLLKHFLQLLFKIQ